MVRNLCKRALLLGLIFAFLVNSFGPAPLAQAQDFVLPAPGTMVNLSPAFAPPVLKGIRVHADNPFRFEFILDKGDSRLGSDQLKDESSKLIKYFLASLTIPEKDLWVNLSPYERDRIVPNSFGQTEMGRDLLAEDYMLKQITASLIYPEEETGKRFWHRIYAEAVKRFGTTNVPVNTFNKVWIVPEKAVVYENAKAGTAYVVESKLKVMLEQDYLSLQKHEGISAPLQVKDTNQLGSQIVREIVIPELTKEVNEDRNFSRLRQVYNSLILATWYKKKIKDSILEQVYADRNKVAGVNIDDPKEKQRIYERYLRAFKKGVFNYIKDTETPDGVSVPRKYFSGGVLLDLAMIGKENTDLNFNGGKGLEVTTNSKAVLPIILGSEDLIQANIAPANGSSLNADSAQLGDLSAYFRTSLNYFETFRDRINLIPAESLATPEGAMEYYSRHTRAFPWIKDRLKTNPRLISRSYFAAVVSHREDFDIGKKQDFSRFAASLRYYEVMEPKILAIPTEVLSTPELAMQYYTIHMKEFPRLDDLDKPEGEQRPIGQSYFIAAVSQRPDFNRVKQQRFKRFAGGLRYYETFKAKILSIPAEDLINPEAAMDYYDKNKDLFPNLEDLDKSSAEQKPIGRSYFIEVVSYRPEFDLSKLFEFQFFATSLRYYEAFEKEFLAIPREDLDNPETLMQYYTDHKQEFPVLEDRGKPTEQQQPISRSYFIGAISHMQGFDETKKQRFIRFASSLQYYEEFEQNFLAIPIEVLSSPEVTMEYYDQNKGQFPRIDDLNKPLSEQRAIGRAYFIDAVSNLPGFDNGKKFNFQYFAASLSYYEAFKLQISAIPSRYLSSPELAMQYYDDNKTQFPRLEDRKKPQSLQRPISRAYFIFAISHRDDFDNAKRGMFSSFATSLRYYEAFEPQFLAIPVEDLSSLDALMRYYYKHRQEFPRLEDLGKTVSERQTIGRGYFVDAVRHRPEFNKSQAEEFRRLAASLRYYEERQMVITRAFHRVLDDKPLEEFKDFMRIYLDAAPQLTQLNSPNTSISIIYFNDVLYSAGLMGSQSHNRWKILSAAVHYALKRQDNIMDIFQKAYRALPDQSKSTLEKLRSVVKKILLKDIEDGGFRQDFLSLKRSRRIGQFLPLGYDTLRLYLPGIFLIYGDEVLESLQRSNFEEVKNKWRLIGENIKLAGSDDLEDAAMNSVLPGGEDRAMANMKPYSLEKVIDDLKKEFGNKLEVSGDPSNLWIAFSVSHSLRLWRILYEVVTNALDVQRGGSHVLVDIYSNEKQVGVRVINEGLWIDFHSLRRKAIELVTEHKLRIMKKDGSVFNVDSFTKTNNEILTRDFLNNSREMTQLDLATIDDMGLLWFDGLSTKTRNYVDRVGIIGGDGGGLADVKTFMDEINGKINFLREGDTTIATLIFPRADAAMSASKEGGEVEEKVSQGVANAVGDELMPGVRGEASEDRAMNVRIAQFRIDRLEKWLRSTSGPEYRDNIGEFDISINSNLFDKDGSLNEIGKQKLEEYLKQKKIIKIKIGGLMSNAQRMTISDYVRLRKRFIGFTSFWMFITSQGKSYRFLHEASAINELLKNAFVHGNRLIMYLPIYLKIDLNSNFVECFDFGITFLGNIYYMWDKSRSKKAILHGFGDGVSMIKINYGFRYGLSGIKEDGIFLGQKVRVDFNKKDWAMTDRNNDAAMSQVLKNKDQSMVIIRREINVVNMPKGIHGAPTYALYKIARQYIPMGIRINLIRGNQTYFMDDLGNLFYANIRNNSFVDIEIIGADAAKAENIFKEIEAVLKGKRGENGNSLSDEDRAKGGIIEKIAMSMEGKDCQGYTIETKVTNIQGVPEVISVYLRKGSHIKRVMEIGVKDSKFKILDIDLLDHNLQGKGIASRLYQLLGDGIPSGTIVEGTIANDETIDNLKDGYYLKEGNVYEKSGLKVVNKLEGEEIAKNEISLAEVMDRTLLGHLSKKYARLKFVDIEFFDDKNPNEQQTGIEALKAFKEAEADPYPVRLFRLKMKYKKEAEDETMSAQGEEDMAMNSGDGGFVETNLPFLEWVNNLPKNFIYRYGEKYLIYLERLHMLLGRNNLSETTDPVLKRMTERFGFVSNQASSISLLQPKGEGSSEEQAWNQIEEEEATGKLRSTKVAETLSNFLFNQNYKYLAKEQARTLLEHLQLFHLLDTGRMPFSILGLTPNMSYYQEYIDAVTNHKIVKVIFFSETGDLAYRPAVDITEFYFVDGEYYGYGHGHLPQNLSAVVLLFHVLKNKRGIPGLSRSIFRQRMEEYKHIILRNGRFEIRNDQYNREIGTLQFYFSLGFRPPQSLKEDLDSYFDEPKVKNRSLDDDEFKSMVNGKYVRLFHATLYLSVQGERERFSTIRLRTILRNYLRNGSIKKNSVHTSNGFNIKDDAMLGERGGVDLTATNNVLQTQSAGQFIKFHIDAAQLAQLQNAPGFVPVIINIQPLKDLYGFLGIVQIK